MDCEHRWTQIQMHRHDGARPELACKCGARAPAHEYLEQVRKLIRVGNEMVIILGDDVLFQPATEEWNKLLGQETPPMSSKDLLVELYGVDKGEDEFFEREKHNGL